MTATLVGVHKQTRHMAPNTNLLKGRDVVWGNPQTLDDDLLAAISAFPYICDVSEANWVVTHSCDFIGYDV